MVGFFLRYLFFLSTFLIGYVVGIKAYMLFTLPYHILYSEHPSRKSHESEDEMRIMAARHATAWQGQRG